MSADNWAICPRCLSEAGEKDQAEIERVAALYGKVPVEEFDAQRAALKPIDPEDYRTLREDYEFSGAEEGTVEADYSCCCSKCGLGTSFNASKQFWPEEA